PAGDVAEHGKGGWSCSAARDRYLVVQSVNEASSHTLSRRSLHRGRAPSHQLRRAKSIAHWCRSYRSRLTHHRWSTTDFRLSLDAVTSSSSQRPKFCSELIPWCNFAPTFRLLRLPTRRSGGRVSKRLGDRDDHIQGVSDHQLDSRIQRARF